MDNPGLGGTLPGFSSGGADTLDVGTPPREGGWCFPAGGWCSGEVVRPDSGNVRPLAVRGGRCDVMNESFMTSDDRNESFMTSSASPGSAPRLLIADRDRGSEGLE